jgi:hypothetical protein
MSGEFEEYSLVKKVPMLLNKQERTRVMRNILISFGLLSGAVLLIYFFHSQETSETIIFFPIDEAAVYQSVNTTLTMLEGKQDNEYEIEWKIQSILGQISYLRQDVGLLYKNGRLKGKLGDWKQNTDKLSQKQRITEKETGKFEAVSFHHSELHDKNDRITSAQNMSVDLLYAINSPYSPMRSFRIPSTKDDQEWKKLIDRTEQRQLEKAMNEAISKLRINMADFYMIWLTELPHYKDKPLPGYSMRETSEIIGRLWEGLYKNYFYGIKKQDGTIVSPIDSTIPLIMVAKDQSSLYVLTESADREVVLLIQQIPKRN